MEIISSLTTQVPIIVASLFLLIVATQKVGKEKGATLVLLGAIGLCLMVVATPIALLFMPKVISSIGAQYIHGIHIAFQLIINVLLAGAITLISFGIFLRSPINKESYPQNVNE